jgi:hypothetical protein
MGHTQSHEPFVGLSCFCILGCKTNKQQQSRGKEKLSKRKSKNVWKQGNATNQDRVKDGKMAFKGQEDKKQAEHNLVGVHGPCSTT